MSIPCDMSSGRIDTLNNLLMSSNCTDTLNKLLMRYYNMGRVMRKPVFCLCENKDADQLCGSRKADQHLCFR